MEVPQPNEDREKLKPKSIGVAIGSGGIYSAAGLGVINRLEQEELKPDYIGGASGGAIIAALYFLEGNAKAAEQELMEKLPQFQDIKFKMRSKPIPGQEVREIINDILDGRNWTDGELKGMCVGAAYTDSGESVTLTQDSGLSLVDSVLASTSLKMIEPIVELNGRKIAHGGDIEYLKGLKDIGSDFVVEVSPNLRSGTIGKMAKVANEISSIFILRGDYLASRKRLGNKSKADFEIHPNLSVKPLVSPLNFSVRNAKYMIKQGEMLTDSSIGSLNQQLAKLDT